MPSWSFKRWTPKPKQAGRPQIAHTCSRGPSEKLTGPRDMTVLSSGFRQLRFGNMRAMSCSPRALMRFGFAAGRRTDFKAHLRRTSAVGEIGAHHGNEVWMLRAGIMAWHDVMAMQSIKKVVARLCGSKNVKTFIAQPRIIWFQHVRRAAFYRARNMSDR